jgi:hypothetical protein
MQRPNDERATQQRVCAPDDHPACPICRITGVEKKQKWFCPRCGQLIQTCCD